jgi:hypothetical protein
LRSTVGSALSTADSGDPKGCWRRCVAVSLILFYYLFIFPYASHAIFLSFFLFFFPSFSSLFPSFFFVSGILEDKEGEEGPQRWLGLSGSSGDRTVAALSRPLHTWGWLAAKSRI